MSPIITTTKTLRPRDPHDHYPTPVALCYAALQHYGQGSHSRILDPGAGTGVWGASARAFYPDAHLTGVELRRSPKPDAYNLWLTQNYLDLDFGRDFDLIIGNPPYKLAEAFIRKALSELTAGGDLVFLLRIAFLAGQDRGKGLWHDYPPRTVGVCSRRPSFTGDGKTDATDYALFHWVKGASGPPPRLEWFDWGAPADTGQLRLLSAEDVA
jgi:hypothetical protein